MLATLRDIAIIILAVESIVAILIVILIALKVYQLIGFARSKTEEFSVLGRGLMESAQQSAQTASQTATQVKGSAEFVSDTVVEPVIQVASAVAGARGFVTALFRLSGSSKKGGRR
jgi:K+ transporter